jgi:hypothetical protein
MNTILNIICQVDVSEHMSEERIIVNYINSEEPDDKQITIVNDADLTPEEKATYDSFKALCLNRLI